MAAAQRLSWWNIAVICARDTIADPADTTDNSEWEIADFPGTSSSNKSPVCARCEHRRLKDIRISWRAQAASQASKIRRLQYTTNGSTFVDFPTSVTLSGSFGTLSNNLAGIAVVNGQANFGSASLRVPEYRDRRGPVPICPSFRRDLYARSRHGFRHGDVYGQPVGATGDVVSTDYVAGNYFQLAVTGSLGFVLRDPTLHEPGNHELAIGADERVTVHSHREQHDRAAAVL